ncbi:MAG: glycosyltransferase family 1 protein [Pedobacter sp.]|nr:MAG: glycosyltransferase family 1 protein [Pedobacter sp.]
MLLLTLKVFSFTGGIEKVCRILSKALQEYSTQSNQHKSALKVISLCDKSSEVDQRYCQGVHFKGFNGNKIIFSTAAFLQGLQKDIIILSHINLIMIAALIKMISKNKRFILLAHGIEVWRDLKPWKISFIKKNVEIWAVSQYTANVLIKKHGFHPSQIKVLNNCIDPYFIIPESFEKPAYLKRRHQLTDEHPIILTVSRLSSFEMYKGYDTVIECIRPLLQDFPNLKYLLAGKADFAEQQRLLQLIKNQQLDHQIILLDYISDQELADYFQLADLFVMPSKKEGFGIVFIEAAACGCPVMAGNQDGSSDALLNGELGILVNPDHQKEIADSIAGFFKVKHTQDKARQLQKRCLDHFNYEVYREKVFGLLNQTKLQFQ